MRDRGMVKWQPFSAVASGNSMIDEVLNERDKLEMPTLSDDQTMELQEKIFKAFNNQEVVNIKYYKAGKLYVNKGKISNIDVSKLKIVINFEISVFFSQIIEVF